MYIYDLNKLNYKVYVVCTMRNNPTYIITLTFFPLVKEFWCDPPPSPRQGLRSNNCINDVFGIPTGF